jgi:hypothetical protein
VCIPSTAAACCCSGTRENPIRYDYFAYLLRPILEAEYRRRRVVYRKISPVAVLCPSDRSPFAPRPGSTVVERFKLCNIGSCLDCWAIKESNFVENYQEVPMGAVCIHDDYILHGSPDGENLRELVCHALGGACASPRSGGGAVAGGWAAADWAAVRAKLASERMRAGPGHTWRLAVPKNHVVAVRLTDEVLRACMSGLPAGMSHLGVALAEGAAVFREETYAPGYAEFRVGDYAVRARASMRARCCVRQKRACGVVWCAPSADTSRALVQISDVAPASSSTFFDRAGTHDRAWVWKPLNKARRLRACCSSTYRDHACCLADTVSICAHCR